MGNHNGSQCKENGENGKESRRSSRNSTVSSRKSSTDGSHNQQAEKAILLPIEKLAKILTQKSQQEENLNGVGLKTFTKYLFPRYPILADRLYRCFHEYSGCKHVYLSTNAFKQQCDKLFSILDDDTIRDNLVRMFAIDDDNDEEDAGANHRKRSAQTTMSPESMRRMLMCSYHVAMDHYSEGPQMCLMINKTLKAVVDGCFHAKQHLSVQFVSHWLASNCPRLVLPLHRYAVHSLATSYRNIEDDGMSLVAGLELATPVLDKPPPFGDKPPHPYLLQMSMSWLLAGALPPMYSKPQKAAHSPSSSGIGLSGATTNYLSKFFCSVPSHWINLYDSDEQGLGANRFLHHVIAYRGATLSLIRAEGGQVFCVAAPCEWKESHLYWGGEESCIFQLLPKFSLLEKGSKMLYLNTSVRGYPLGLRAGKDPRAPIISIDGGFEKFEFQKIPYALGTLEVWGCGDKSSRDAQLDVKKWQVKEAERQRCVKLSAADWLDHPDRYLLELAGRPQYHQKQNQ